jgi:hypothetical protein
MNPLLLQQKVKTAADWKEVYDSFGHSPRPKRTLQPDHPQIGSLQGSQYLQPEDIGKCAAD